MGLVNNLMVLPNIPVTMQPYFALFEVANLSGDPRGKSGKCGGGEEARTRELEEGGNGEKRVG